MSIFRKMAGQSTAADAGLQRRCNELRAEKAALSLQLRHKSEELSVLRNTLAAAPDTLLRAKGAELAKRLCDAFRHGPLDGVITLRRGSALHELAQEVARESHKN